MTSTHIPRNPRPPAPTASDRDVRDRLARDIDFLCALDRRTGRDGEQRSAAYIAERLRQAGAHDVAESIFRTQPSWTPVHVAHIAAGMIAAALPGSTARVVNAAVAASYELDVSGRSQWSRRFLPGARGTSVSARIPAAAEARRHLVLVAHHDAAQTGLVWGPAAVAASRYLSRQTGRAIPSHLPALAALSAMAVPSRSVRTAACAVLAGTAALMIQSMRSPTTPGANDNASGVATVLELARRLAAAPLPETEIHLVLPGGEEVGSLGIQAWLEHIDGRLDPQRTLVVNIDAVGSRGHLVVARHESLTGRIAGGCVERAVNTAAEADIEISTATLPNPTDAVALTRAGLPTISLLSGEDGWISHLHRMSDTIDNVDWQTVNDAVTLTELIAKGWDGWGHSTYE
ncbi:M28 family metallopeptidase [Nocardia anaemiae]|uniref:M28 family metallopeptidase n=1 Tax=Nocardia anaemiae TaxID=263910 RepID=UPI0007A4CE7A|nr:M28 family peptidase [Nocardia anaemiae]